MNEWPEKTGMTKREKTTARPVAGVVSMPGAPGLEECRKTSRKNSRKFSSRRTKANSPLRPSPTTCAPHGYHRQRLPLPLALGRERLARPVGDGRGKGTSALRGSSVARRGDEAHTFCTLVKDEAYVCP